MSQSECSRLKQYIKVVWTGSRLIEGRCIYERSQNLSENVCELENLTLCQLDCPVEGTHSVEVLALVQELTQALEELLEDIRLNVGWSEYREAGLTLGVGGCSLSEQEFLNAGCCIGLVNLTFTLEEVGDLIQENWDVLIGQLIPEHIDELYASSLQLA
jgi:hypothetical protein